jgi:hypothetical protein
LGFAVTFLSRYLHKLGEKHLTAAKHVLHYLKGTIDFGIRYTRVEARLLARDQTLHVLYGLSDSDFTGCKDMSRSAFGYMVLMNGGVVAYYRPLSQLGSRRKRCPCQFGQACMGSIPATSSTKHASCFPPSSIPASIEISIKLIVCGSLLFW